MISLKEHPVRTALIIIFIIAVFFRFYRLETLPANFHEDEVLSGYVGHYILKNGFDLYGNRWPLLYFNKFGDYYIIGPIYLAGLSTFIFGVNHFATRFPSALFGALLVLPVFWFAWRIFNNKLIGLASALLIAVTPCQIVLSRSTTEGIIGCTVYLTAVLLLLKSTEKHHFKSLLTAFFLFIFSYFIYHPYRLYVPLIFLAGLVIFFKQIKNHRQFFTVFLLFTVIFVSLTGYISQTPWGKGRFAQTSIFSVLSGVSIKINELIFNEGENRIILARTFHNKLTGYGREFLKQYLSYFSPEFLFISGWHKRYTVPEQGLLYFSYLGLILAGLLSVKTNLKINSLYLRFLLLLLFLAPAPAALTVVESPNVHRSVFLSVPLVILATYGYYKLSLITIGKIKLVWIIWFFLGLEVVNFWHNYSRHMDLYSSLHRNDGQRQVAMFAIEKEATYDQIILPAEGAMSWYYLFYKKDFNPKYAKQFRLDARIDQTNKIRYIDNPCPNAVVQPNQLSKKVLIIARHDCVIDENLYQDAGRIQGVNPLLAYKVLKPK